MEHKVNTGGQVWNGALALTSYFERIGLRETLRSAASLRGPAIQAKKAAALAAGVAYVEAPLSRPTPYRILELGAGTGYVGLWLVHHGADVLLTDLAVQMTTLRSNLYINLASHSADGIDLTARADQFEWGAPRIGPIDDDDDDDDLVTAKNNNNSNTDITNSASTSNRETVISSSLIPPTDDQWDHIICSDVLYAVGAHHLLVHSLDWLTSNRTTVWVSYQHRRKAESGFFDQISELGFVHEQVHAEGNASSLEEHDPYITIHRITRSDDAALKARPAREAMYKRVAIAMEQHRHHQRQLQLQQQQSSSSSRNNRNTKSLPSSSSSSSSSSIVGVTDSSASPIMITSTNSDTSSNSSNSSSNGDVDVEEPEDTSFRPEGNDFLDFL